MISNRFSCFRSQLTFPGLAHEIRTERALRFFFDQLESRFSVEFACGQKTALRPKSDFLISALASKLDAFAHEPTTDTESSRVWFDEEQPQLRDLVCVLDEKNRTDGFAIQFGNPAALAVGIEVLDELCPNVSHQRLE